MSIEDRINKLSKLASGLTQSEVKRMALIAGKLMQLNGAGTVPGVPDEEPPTEEEIKYFRAKINQI